jgi:DNA-binding response OmpR family regulator
MDQFSSWIAMARLLLVDDDAMVRDMLAVTLTAAGHTVVQAENGREGAKLFRAAPTDLVITDLVMPDREGLETISELRAEWPTLPIIAMSGGMRSPVYLRLATKLGAQRTLAKPFTADALLGAIDELLGRRAEPPGNA